MLGKIEGRRRRGTDSSIFAWRIAWTEEPDELQFMGLRMIEHN